MPEIPEQLFAKSKSKLTGNTLTLVQHSIDADQAVKLIFRLDSRWGQNWCRFFRIQGKAKQQKFLLNLRIAALFHDIGKANADFYIAVTKPGYTPQTLRHEHLSALILCLPDVRQWLKQNPALDVDAITAAVLSHHLKASDDISTVVETTDAGKRLKSYRWCQPSADAAKEFVVLYFQHQQVISILNRIAAVANLEAVPTLPTVNWQAGTIWEQAYKKGRQLAEYFSENLEDDPQRSLMTSAIKAGLIVADAAASSLVREGKDIEDWLEDVVHAAPIGMNDIAKSILEPRAQQIERKTGQTFKLQTFQTQMAAQSSKALLIAACGTGKTLGAWKWAEAQSRQFNIGKVIFLYPTRGTATEGFRNYVGWALEEEAALVTGTARYELDAMQENPSEATKGKDFQADARLFALGFWSRRYFSATVDQFLSFMEHRYSSLCLLPALADSAVIIDEVHSFDRRMFDTLISFLQHFDIPVLCMTATLPTSRRQELINAGLTVFPTQDDRDTLKDLKEKEEHHRYELETIEGFDVAFKKAVSAYQAGERVLWVVNTVNRCLAIAEKLEQHESLRHLDAKVLSYHSRFRLCDRQRIHAQTVQAFERQQNEKARESVIAVTTQVCEMSLDLDADVLITEVAPVSSLVQRFGRANRHLVRGKNFRANLYTYHPPSNLPYTKEELENATAFLAELSHHQPMSQHQLAEALERHSQAERKADGIARFLSSGYYATPRDFRDTDEFSVPCILDSEEDLEKVRAILDSNEKHQKEQYIINVPRKWASLETEHHGWLPKYLGVAPTIGHYDNPDRGFITKPLEEVDLG